MFIQMDTTREENELSFDRLLLYCDSITARSDCSRL